MRLYSTHFAIPDPAISSERPPVLIPEGFSWGGLVFGWLVLLRRGSWLGAALAGLATLLIGLLGSDAGGLHVPGIWALLPGLHLAIGLFANDWRRWELGQAGFTAGPVVAGHDAAAALLRLLDLRPGLLGPGPGRPPVPSP